MIQPVVITYWFGSADCYARISTSQTVTMEDGCAVSTERSADYTLECVGLPDAAQVEFSALVAAGQADGEPLQAFIGVHGLVLGLPGVV
jgi:hypothetical protein